jgi:hypothetical protein
MRVPSRESPEPRRSLSPSLSLRRETERRDLYGDTFPAYYTSRPRLRYLVPRRVTRPPSAPFLGFPPAPPPMRARVRGCAGARVRARVAGHGLGRSSDRAIGESADPCGPQAGTLCMIYRADHHARTSCKLIVLSALMKIANSSAQCVAYSRRYAHAKYAVRNFCKPAPHPYDPPSRLNYHLARRAVVNQTRVNFAPSATSNSDNKARACAY